MKRDNSFDNLKLVLIFFVIFGHVLEEFGTEDKLGTWRAVIYSFHMPLFIFISGYFSKNTFKIMKNNLISCLVPYLLFNSAYQILSGKYRLNIFFPVYIYWYMLSLFFWRCILCSIKDIKWSILMIVTVLLSLHIGIYTHADRFLSISRTIGFLPFFAAGFLCEENIIKKIRNIPKRITLLILGINLVFTIKWNKLGIIECKMYEFIQSYESTGLTNWDGICQRMVIFVSAAVYIVCLINLVPKKKMMVSKYGQRTVIIYLLSGLFVKGIMSVLLKTEWMKYIQKNSVWIILFAVILSLLMIIVCGNHLIMNVYSKVLERVRCILINTKILDKT